MAQGSFSQQRGVDQSRITRTERIKQAQKEQRERNEFESARAEANRLRSSVFIDKPNDPFTFEGYSSKYQQLSPNVQQFFLSPTEITSKKNIRIEVERKSFNTNITTFTNKVTEAQEKLNKFYEYERTYPYSRDNDQRARQKLYIRKRQDKKENDVKEAEAQLRYLQGQSGKINQGYSAGDLVDYADDKASFDRRKWDARDSSQYKFKSDLQSGKLDAVIKSIGISKDKVNYRSFNESVAKYNANISQVNQLKKWGGKVGFLNLPDYAQQRINPKAIEFQKLYPDEKITFSPTGEVNSIESKAFGGSFSPTEYNLKVKAQQQRIEEVGQEQFEKEWREKQYIKWKKENRKEDEIVTPSGLYVTKENMDAFLSTDPMETNLSNLEDQESILSKAVKFPVIKQGVGGYNWVKERVHFDIAGTGSSPKLNISFGKIDKPTIVETLAEETRGELRKAQTNIDEWVIGKEKIEEFKTEKETKYQGIYQTAFEDKYMKNIIVDQAPFENAEARFKESDEAKKIQEQYQKEYELGYNQLQKDVDFWSLKGIKGGVAQTGIGLASVGTTLVDNPVDLLATSGALYGATSLIGALPSSIKLGLTGTFFVTGTAKAFDPTATYSERGAGLTTAIITGASLGYSGIKYLKSPVVKTANIKPPKMNIRASQTLGKDIKIIGADGKVTNKVFYGQQKLSQTGIAGRRTIVTTKWRALSNKYLGTNLKNIYEGIPANQPAQFVRLTGIRGNVLVKTAPSGYENARNLLKKYGYSDYQATSTLRYYAPKMQDVWLEKGLINVGSKGAKAQFTFTQRQPVIEYTDKGLNIKTRSARVIQDKYNVNRKLVTINDQSFVMENKFRVGNFLDKRGNIVKLKDFEFSQTKNLVKVSDSKKGFDYLGKQNGADLFKPVKYKDLVSFSKDNWAIKVTPKRTTTIIEALNNQRRLDITRSTLSDWNVDLSKAGTQKPLFTFTKGGGKTDYSAWATEGSKDMNKVINKLNKVVGSSSRTGGTTISTPSPSQVTQLDLKQQLKAIITTPKTTQVAQMGAITDLSASNLDALMLGQGVAVASQFNLRSSTKQDIELKNMLKNMDITKTSQLQQSQLRSVQGTKTAQIQALALTPALSGVNIWQGGTYNPPTPLKSPKFKPPVIFAVAKKIQKKRKSSRDKLSPELLGMFPDFTSRAVGLKPQEFGSVKDALKEMRKIKTGFGIRRGARLKKKGGFSEKDLLKGITQ